MQKALYDAQTRNVIRANPLFTTEQVGAEVAKFLSPPTIDPELRKSQPSPHTTGSAIDLGLIQVSGEGQNEMATLQAAYKKGSLSYSVAADEKALFDQAQGYIDSLGLPDEFKRNWLGNYRYGMKMNEIFRKYGTVVDMGTGFDSFEPIARSNHYENIQSPSCKEQQIRDNRRVLFSVMTQAGFANYPDEWWHWSYGDQEWAQITKQSAAMYGEIRNLDPEVIALEEVARKIYAGTAHSIKNKRQVIFMRKDEL